MINHMHSPKPRWWDRRALHLFWSYASWATLILSAYGWKTPRRKFSEYSRRS